MISPLVLKVKHCPYSVPDTVPVPNETNSERLRRESDELLKTAAKQIEHAATFEARAAEMQEQISQRERNIKQKKAFEMALFR